MPFVNLGLVPEAGSSLLAPLRFGRAKAAEFLMLAEPFDGEAARELGFVNALVPPTRFSPMRSPRRRRSPPSRARRCSRRAG